MESNVENSQVVYDFVAAQNLERYDERVGHEVIVYGAVEYLYGSIVRGSGKEGILGVILDGANRVCVVAKGLVWLGRIVEIEPIDTLIVGTNDDVVSRWVDVHGRDPLHAGNELLDHLLLH